MSFAFTRGAGAVYEVLYSTNIPSTNWLTLTNFPVAPSNSPVSVTGPIGTGLSRFYQVRMTIP